MTFTYVAAFLAALVSALAATPVVRRAAIRFQILDHPSDRKGHPDPVPYLGGVAIIVAFTVTVVAGAVVRGAGAAGPQIIAILGGALLLAGMGLWDDLRQVPGWVKVPIEIALGVVLFFAGSRAQLFGIWPLDLLITIGWVVGITNAVNYMDNMDGLTAGVVTIASAYYLALAGLSGQFLVAALSAALAGCALGFLWHNRPPARIFMGDAGSLFMGFILAGLGLELRFENIPRVTFFVPVAVMSVVILDALMVSVSRVKKGLSPIQPGRDHISHRLVKTGIPPKGAVGIIYFAAAAAGWIGLVISLAEPKIAYMLMGWVVAVGLFAGLLLLRVDV
ncbi:MAG TPA: MraY family glycosyltransferase [Actinomycetota bacterium]|nr:MraY family glycosyltransferase [Actinomycetota bacterium]